MRKQPYMKSGGRQLAVSIAPQQGEGWPSRVPEGEQTRAYSSQPDQWMPCWQDSLCQITELYHWLVTVSLKVCLPGANVHEHQGTLKMAREATTMVSSSG
jgi:hypothetical protein